MNPFSLDYPCPPWLEDEALLIEHAGEMPEVALAESLHHLGGLAPEELACLQAACARGYLAIIRRDLDPANIGLPVFRGLERARVNLARLERFLAGLGGVLPPGVRAGLAADLERFLAAEQEALDLGRPYTAAPPGQARALARELGLEVDQWQGLWERLADLPAPDFLGLRALRRLEAPAAAAKRRQVRDGRLVVELVDGEGRVLAAAALPWHSPAAAVAEENRARAEEVWALLPQPARP